MCSIPSGRATQQCMRSSHTDLTGAGEVRVGERTDRQSHVLGVDPVVDRRAALRAEEERALLALVGAPDVLGRVALDPRMLAGPACLRPEHAACAPLAGKAVVPR